ncbi:MAG TPA: shikimate dehydrogenase [Candidatus Saccharimonadales bacterium]|nr:shikimate dehydrogenase [Candidatus Saccharimonadales bacterium]
MRISAKTNICLIIGDPVAQSLSPQMHNAGYETLGIDDKFVFLATRIVPKDLEAVIKGLRTMQVKGITVTHPHKIAVMQYLDIVDETAEKIGAVNTIVNNGGVLTGSNTDWIGVVDAIEKITSLRDKKVALIGAGGAARAAVYGVITKGAQATIFNRTVGKAEEIAREFNCNFASLDELEKIKDKDIIINLTPVSMDNKSLIDKNLLTEKHIVFDAVYAPYETPLLQAAKEKGARIIHGTEWLLYQGLAQFEIYTERKAPEDEMRKILMENI